MPLAALIGIGSRIWFALVEAIAEGNILARFRIYYFKIGLIWTVILIKVYILKLCIEYLWDKISPLFDSIQVVMPPMLFEGIQRVLPDNFGECLTVIIAAKAISFFFSISTKFVSFVTSTL
ncbi:DUF5455 family protein [Salinicola acroporae]|uniref:YggT family protein n=1 Tax=Salinicola acroporae TaxID=1541440 RepID=A0ABT6HZV9_9GAMM|nr:DUF5455 family protein [Salinicola acroporae]MDH4571031.1 hypothetical protein [Salinicola acroporae]